MLDTDDRYGATLGPARARRSPGIHAGRVAWFGGAVLLLQGCASGGPAPPRTEVVWARGDRVAVASADSLGFEVGDRLGFLSGGRSVATAEVVGKLEATIALARLTSGSLARVKSLAALDVRAERPPTRPRPVLRVGYPSAIRTTLLFECAGAALDSSAVRHGYRVDAREPRAYRLVRDAAIAGGRPWPDTLLVRLFDEATDQEIALERGELDAAVFWPGELSQHMRMEPRWRGFPYGRRARGALVAYADSLLEGGGGGPDAPGAIDTAAFAALNRELFRGDLALLGAARPFPADSADTAPSAGAAPGAAASGAARYEADRACPGWQALERVLNRGERGDSPPERARVIRVRYEDAPIGSLDPSALPVAAIRCPLVSEAGLRPYLAAIGTDALADLFECAPSGTSP